MSQSTWDVTFTQCHAAVGKNEARCLVSVTVMSQQGENSFPIENMWHLQFIYSAYYYEP